MRLHSLRRVAARRPALRASERGFTLIETLIAMIVLTVGLVAVSHLILVASSSNAIANRSTAAASLASLQMERLMTIPFADLDAGGTVEGDPPETPDDFTLFEDLGGSSGAFFTRWEIIDMDEGGLKCIRVRTQARGAFSDLTRAELTTFRAQNAVPAASASPGASPTP